MLSCVSFCTRLVFSTDGETDARHRARGRRPSGLADRHAVRRPGGRALIDLGLQLSYMATDVLVEMPGLVRKHSDRIVLERILPRVSSNQSAAA